MTKPTIGICWDILSTISQFTVTVALSGCYASKDKVTHGKKQYCSYNNNIYLIVNIRNYSFRFKMATLMKAPQRYTHPEWTHSNKTKYKNAEKERQASERLVEESKRLVSETQDRADKAQADVNMKLGG